MKYPKLPPNKDRRVKIPKSFHPTIRQLRKQGAGVRELARAYGVDKRLIQFILDPNVHKENLRLREARGGSMAYYDKDKRRDYMRSHRKYKHSLQHEEVLAWRRAKRAAKRVIEKPIYFLPKRKENK